MLAKRIWVAEWGPFPPAVINEGWQSPYGHTVDYEDSTLIQSNIYRAMALPVLCLICVFYFLRLMMQHIMQ